MERVTIGKLRNRLSAYLRKVRAGETILVLDRDTVIARLTPATEAETDDERLARLEAKGVLRRGKKPWDPSILRGPVSAEGGGALQALLDEREEGR